MDQSKKDCPCKRKCKRHGLCRQCRQFHRQEAKHPLTTCQRLRKDTDRKLKRQNPSS